MSEEHLLRENLIEKDIANIIRNNPDMIEPNLILIEEGIRTDAGILDSLWKDQNDTYLVVEYKRRKASDKVVGQITRYMGWVKEKYSIDKVRGIILCQEADPALNFAATMVPNLEIIEFGPLKNPKFLASTRISPQKMIELPEFFKNWLLSLISWWGDLSSKFEEDSGAVMDAINLFSLSDVISNTVDMFEKIVENEWYDKEYEHVFDPALHLLRNIRSQLDSLIKKMRQYKKEI